jgi:WD40 repeat protein
MEEVVETLGTITSLKCSNNGKLIAIGSDEAKCIIYNTSTGEKNKCRPGHISGIISVWFSSDDRYVCSIGRDQLVLIYDLAGEEPQEVARYGITNSGNHDNLIGSFHLSKYIVYLPGRN